MESKITQPPFEFEINRRMLCLSMGDTLPATYADNSGAVISALFRNVYFFSSGAVGANKTQEYGYAVEHISIVPGDILGMVSDGAAFGQWKHPVVFESLVRPHGKAGAVTPTSYMGIGLGTYGAVPPDPATTVLTNVVRLVIQMDTMKWYLIVHPADGVSLATKTILTNVTDPVLARGQRVRLVHVPGQYVRAYIDGILGIEYPVSLPDVRGVANTWFVASGAGAANVRGAFSYPRITWYV